MITAQIDRPIKIRSLQSRKTTYNGYFNKDGSQTKLTKSHFPNVFNSVTDFDVRLIDTEIVETVENYFTKDNLYNSDYCYLQSFDFELYEYYLRKNKQSRFKTELDFSRYKDTLMKSIRNSTEQSPVLLKGTNNKHWLIMGYGKLLTFKLFGIKPIVKIIRINTEIKL